MLIFDPLLATFKTILAPKTKPLSTKLSFSNRWNTLQNLRHSNEFSKKVELNTSLKSYFTVIFNPVSIRLVVQVKISLLLKIQWQEHDYLSEHGCGSVQELRSCDNDDAESGSTCRARGEDVEIGIGWG